MAQSMSSIHLSIADITPSIRHLPVANITPTSTQPEEEEHVLATIGHLPEPWVESAQKALQVTELLEGILVEVGKTHLTTLLLSHRVNKQFSNTIKNSPKLQRALFFELNPSVKAPSIKSGAVVEPIKPRINPYVHYENDPDFVMTQGHRCGDEECKIRHPGNSNPDNIDETWWFLLLQVGWISPLNIDEDDENASWRRMWTTDPPVEIHQIRCKDLKGEDKKLLKMGPLMDLVKKTGIAQRTKPGSQLDDYFEVAAPRWMKIPPSKRSTKIRDREIAEGQRWAYTKVIMYFTYWMLILFPVGFGRSTYIGFAVFYLFVKILVAVLWVRRDRANAREAIRQAKILQIKQKADEEAAKIAKMKAEEAEFRMLVGLAAQNHDMTKRMVKYMRIAFDKWVSEGRPKRYKVVK